MNKNIIYLDNAATSYHKPEIYYKTFAQLNLNLGNPGRGSYKSSLEAAQSILNSRILISQLLNSPDIENLIFTPGCTYAINTVINGFIHQQQFRDKVANVLVSPLEHNAVMRPLFHLEKQNKVKIHYLTYNLKTVIDFQELANFTQTHAIDIVFINHVSNVTGQIIDLDLVRETIKTSTALAVDAAQSLPYYRYDLKQQNLSFLMIAGHKGLMGPIGTGVIYINDEWQNIDPLIFGGTGSYSDNLAMPNYLPDKFEAGSINAALIGTLGASINYLLQLNLPSIISNQTKMAYNFIEWSKKIGNQIQLFGIDKNISITNYQKNYMPVISFRLTGIDNSNLISYLDENYQICLRSGLHCSMLTHKNLNTLNTGLIRLSLGHFNTSRDIEILCNGIENFLKTQ